MNFLAIILARKNSKRLKNKNLLLLKRKPLISWTIDFCKKIFPSDQILLSTDSSKMMDIALRSQILCPWLRPKKLSTDTAKSEDACMHAIEWYNKNVKKLEGVILMQPTSPYRSIRLIKTGIKKFCKTKRNVIAVSESKYLKSSYHKKDAEEFIIENNALIRNNKNNKKNKIYKINGSFYASLVKNLKKNKSFYAPNSIPLLTNSVKYSLDIDNLKDFKIAKKIN